MEFEKYDKEVHSEMVKPDFAELCLEIDNIEKYRSIIEEELETFMMCSG